MRTAEEEERRLDSNKLLLVSPVCMYFQQFSSELCLQYYTALPAQTGN